MATERAHHGKASIEQETVRPCLSRLFAPFGRAASLPGCCSLPRTQYAVEESLEKLAWWAWWAHGPQRTYPLVRPVPHPLKAGRALRSPITYPHAGHHPARAHGRAASVAHARHRREARALPLFLVAAASIRQGSLTDSSSSSSPQNLIVEDLAPVRVEYLGSRAHGVMARSLAHRSMERSALSARQQVVYGRRLGGL